MLTYPDLNPIAFSLGPLKVHWYGLMYAVGFIGGWLLGLLRARRPNSGWTKDQVGDLMFFTALGVIIGGRMGDMLFYNLDHFLAHPLDAFKLWQGGMSFHGGLLGVAVAFWLLSRKIHKPFMTIADFAAPLVTIGLGAGRIGNFINGELWGRVTDVPWAMVFPQAGPLARHPSQIYEFLLEGVLMFTILWIYSSKPRPRMAVSGLFLLLYGVFRFMVEFVREPEAGQLGYMTLDWLTKGQLLSIPMVLIGILFMVYAYRKNAISK